MLYCYNNITVHAAVPLQHLPYFWTCIGYNTYEVLCWIWPCLALPCGHWTVHTAISTLDQSKYRCMVYVIPILVFSHKSHFTNCYKKLHTPRFCLGYTILTSDQQWRPWDCRDLQTTCRFVDNRFRFLHRGYGTPLA